MLQANPHSTQFTNVPISQIERMSFLELRTEYEEDEEFVELVKSITEHGILEPLIVRPAMDQSGSIRDSQKYELICGYRRFLACKKLGLDSVPCIIMELSDRQAFEASLIENIQRKSLNPIEEAEAYKSYVFNFGRGSISRLAERIGKSEEYVSHRLLLLGLPKQIQDRITKKLLDPSHAMELVWLKDVNKQLETYQMISKYRLSLRELRSVIKKVKEGVPVSEAVEQAIYYRNMAKSNRNGVNRNSGTPDSWPYYRSEVENTDKDRKLQILDKAIILMRGSLTGLDFLVHQSETLPDVMEILMESRRRVHSILDDLIRKKLQYKKDYLYN
ncbi:MAG: ParB/RepB/Spo0J family partition protein [Conexivisphaerales archaeon]